MPKEPFSETGNFSVRLCVVSCELTCPPLSGVRNACTFQSRPDFHGTFICVDVRRSPRRRARGDVVGQDQRVRYAKAATSPCSTRRVHIIPKSAWSAATARFPSRTATSKSSCPPSYWRGIQQSSRCDGSTFTGIDRFSRMPPRKAVNRRLNALRMNLRAHWRRLFELRESFLHRCSRSSLTSSRNRPTSCRISSSCPIISCITSPS